jgi:hypothetical protein
VTRQSKSRPPPEAGFTDNKGRQGQRTRFVAIEEPGLPWATGGIYTVELYARARQLAGPRTQGKFASQDARRLRLHSFAARVNSYVNNLSIATV